MKIDEIKNRNFNFQLSIITEYANRSDNFPRFIYLDSLLEVTLFCTSWWQRGNLKAFFFIFLPFQFFFGVGVAENSNFDWLFGSVRRPCAQKWDIVTVWDTQWDKIHEHTIKAMGCHVMHCIKVCPIHLNWTGLHRR